MWEELLGWLQSLTTVDSLAKLLLGGMIGVWFSIKSNKPRLVVRGGGGGGSRGYMTWSITISNRPSFFGQILHGETAHDLRATIRLNHKGAHEYPVYWGSEQKTLETIEPGQQSTLNLFKWADGTDGYHIVDQEGDFIANFQENENRFILTLLDRLERRTEFKFSVGFDDPNIKQVPQLHIGHPLSLDQRIYLVKAGLREFFSAFKLK